MSSSSPRNRSWVGGVGVQRGRVEGEAGAWSYRPLIVQCGTDLDFILKAMTDC